MRAYTMGSPCVSSSSGTLGPGSDALEKAVSFSLPPNYNFEVQKTINRIKSLNAKSVLLQLPEGLLQWGQSLSEIISQFTEADVIIDGDVTYGACCIDDILASCLSVDLLVHYGHSCLVPVDHVSVPCMYVFVDILFDVDHLVETVKVNWDKLVCDSERKLGLMGTIQYSTALHMAAEDLKLWADEASVVVPQLKPLTHGEVLGCTSPHIAKDIDSVVFVSDGRFHLESALIQNPHVKFFRYDPFTQELLAETYAHSLLHRNRQDAISAAVSTPADVPIGLILSTLGRQGSVGILESLQELLNKCDRRWVVFLLSEIQPDRIAKLKGISCFIQVGCPRLSLDWGHFYCRPLLTPYEAHVAFGQTAYKDGNNYIYCSGWIIGG
eukprot:GHVQ01030328.1.p1 GENE.GHVQ01030328.1~~GHVQ01030328.1.p1  ORF type:complete len:382 (-),score=42.11 GHVQ01030328.1:102-1247(-)